MRFMKFGQESESNIFNQLDEKRQELAARGVDVINLSIGTPDFQPGRHVMQAVSAAALRLLCRETGEQTQTYANRSDLPGGSTLGSISDTRVAVPTVDIGLAQLAMHSAYETMGARDLDSLVRVMTAYFGRTPRWNAGAMQLV